MGIIQRLSYLGKNGYNGYTAFLRLNHAGLRVTAMRLKSGYRAVTPWAAWGRAEKARGAQTWGNGGETLTDRQP